MKLRAKILPKYFDQIKAGTKTVDYRQIEDITFINTETDEEITYNIRNIMRRPVWDFERIQKLYPDVVFIEDCPIYKIVLSETRI